MAINQHLNIADLEMLYGDRLDGGSTKDTDNYRRYGTFLEPTLMKEYCEHILELANRLTGHGPYRNSLQTFLSRLDRYNNAIPPLNSLNVGYTFITRPRLNMTSGNLRQHPITNTLISANPDSVSFMMRMLLDTRMTQGLQVRKGPKSPRRSNPEFDNMQQILLNYSSLVDIHNPFFVPLCNAMTSISGFPDLNVETETTEADFHSSDFVFAKGSDLLMRSTELTLEFNDVQGSIILSTFYFWCLIIALQAKGILMAYPDDIYEQRLNYTVSIYRFVTDPSRKFIRWWAKATGCFPKSVPIGSIFNYSAGDSTITAANNFSIPFSCGKVEINEPNIFMDFNTLVQRHCPDILDSSKFIDIDMKPISRHGGLNFIGLPYILSTRGHNRLAWMTNTEYLATAGYEGYMGDLEKEYPSLHKIDEGGIETLTLQKNALSNMNKTVAMYQADLERDLNRPIKI